MKQCVDTYVEPITVLIINSCYQLIFPDELKVARVVSIFKSGNSSKMNNYRPIQKKSKIYERLMYNNVFNFMNKKELIYKYHFSSKSLNTTSNNNSC